MPAIVRAGRAWVVGSQGGIGAACVQRFTSDGWQVRASDRPDEDLAERGAAERVAADLARSGGFDAAVHAIGMSGRRLGDGPVSQCTDEGWDEVLRVDLTSAFYFLRACLRHANDAASIVLVGSALATSNDADFMTVAYRVAKSALAPLMEAAAYEGAARGIRVNIVAPGLVETSMAARALGDERIRSRFAELMPSSGRAASAGEVASAISWLATSESSQTTAAVIPVDGGWHLHARFPANEEGR